MAAEQPATRNVAHDVSPDGQRFVCVIPSASDESFAPITVVLNWQATLKK